MLEEQLNGLYEQYGYRKFRMSKFEDYDLYAQNKDFLKSGHIITFTDVDGELKALKPDITLSIMKNNNGSSEKVYYNENVYRDMGGTFKEILQVGVESVGQLDPYAEAEGIALALEFKLGGEVLRTVIVREWTELLILGAIIALRGALTLLIHWEISVEEKREKQLLEIHKD